MVYAIISNNCLDITVTTKPNKRTAEYRGGALLCSFSSCNCLLTNLWKYGIIKMHNSRIRVSKLHGGAHGNTAAYASWRAWKSSFTSLNDAYGSTPYYFWRFESATSMKRLHGLIFLILSDEKLYDPSPFLIDGSLLPVTGKHLVRLVGYRIPLHRQYSHNTPLLPLYCLTAQCTCRCQGVGDTERIGYLQRRLLI